MHDLIFLSLGSSTACIVVLDRRSHRIHTCNLGDSGFLVVRGGEVVHRSDEQQHYFNTPFQLSIAPPGAEGVVLSDRWVNHASRYWIHSLRCHRCLHVTYRRHRCQILITTELFAVVGMLWCFFSSV